MWTGYTHESGNQNESESVGRHSGQGAQGRGVRRQGGEGVDLEEGNEEDDILPQRRRRQGVEYELDEYLHEDGDGVAYESENRAAHSRNHAEELLFQRRQSAHSELPRRHQTLPSRFAPEYDHEIRGHERGARRGARDGGVRRGHGGSEDAPPRYEDHVFDRVVDDDDNNDDA